MEAARRGGDARGGERDEEAAKRGGAGGGGRAPRRLSETLRRRALDHLVAKAGSDGSPGAPRGPPRGSAARDREPVEIGERARYASCAACASSSSQAASASPGGPARGPRRARGRLVGCGRVAASHAAPSTHRTRRSERPQGGARRDATAILWFGGQSGSGGPSEQPRTRRSERHGNRHEAWRRTGEEQARGASPGPERLLLERGGVAEADDEAVRNHHRSQLQRHEQPGEQEARARHVRGAARARRPRSA